MELPSKQDVIVSKIFFALLRDFRRLHGDDFARGAETAFRAGIKEFRDFDWPALGLVDASRFKAWHQLKNLFKRYRFENDVYSDAELTELTISKFVKFQEERSTYHPLKCSTYRVLQRARCIAKRILTSQCNVPDHSYRIGKRATLGGPLSTAYIDCKLGEPKAFTCPSALRKWWFSHISDDPVLKGVMRQIFKKSKSSGTALNLSADFLNLVLVPKSWKIHRPITPLSLVGLYYSYGLGSAIADGLRTEGLNIKHLQKRHQKLARRYSHTRSHVTADLSSASDSLTSDILNRVLPRAWYTSVKKTFIRQLHFDERCIYTSSVLPMGNGATFPVETLVFYCIVKAIGDLAGVNGTFSVYGDDLIYPKGIHPYVMHVFADLGFGVNKDKTFVHSHFRESCGGDYYRGFDVRPALLPEKTSPHLKGLHYQQFLYKVLNSLRRRWATEEIQEVFNLLITELANVSKVILQVPPSFPDTSGLKTDVPYVSWYIPFSQPKQFFRDGSAWISFRHIITTSKKRQIVTEIPFYWDKLRSIASRAPDWRAGFGWYRSFPPDPQLEAVWMSGKRVLCCPSHEEGHPKNEVCTVSNWT